MATASSKSYQKGQNKNKTESQINTKKITVYYEATGNISSIVRSEVRKLKEIDILYEFELVSRERRGGVDGKEERGAIVPRDQKVLVFLSTEDINKTDIKRILQPTGHVRSSLKSLVIIDPVLSSDTSLGRLLHPEFERVVKYNTNTEVEVKHSRDKLEEFIKQDIIEKDDSHIDKKKITVYYKAAGDISSTVWSEVRALESKLNEINILYEIDLVSREKRSEKDGVKESTIVPQDQKVLVFLSTTDINLSTTDINKTEIDIKRILKPTEHIKKSLKCLVIIDPVLSVDTSLERLLQQEGKNIVKYSTKTEVDKLEEFIKNDIKEKVKIFCSKKTSLLKEVSRFFGTKLKLQHDIDSQYNRVRDVRDEHVFVVCLERSRLIPDIQDTVEKLSPQLSKRYCILYLRHREQHTLDQEIFNSYFPLPKDDYLSKFGSIIDCVYNKNSEIYNCEVNDNAGRLIKRFLRKKMGNGAGVQRDDNLLPIPWRDVGFTRLNTKQSLNRLKKEIGELKPSDENININIAILGKLQAGKSSFINTVHTAFEDHATTPAYAAPSNRNVTPRYTKYEVNNKTCSYFRLCDTRGIENDFGVGMSDFKNLVEGHIKNNYKFDENRQIKEGHSSYISSPKFNDKMHCICFVFDANRLTQTQTPEYNSVKTFLKTIGDTYKVRFVVLLTHLDQVCKTVRLRADLIYQSREVFKMVQLVARKLEISEHYIVPVVNYTSQTEFSQPFSILALLALRQMLRKCKDYYNEHKPTVESDEFNER